MSALSLAGPKAQEAQIHTPPSKTHVVEVGESLSGIAEQKLRREGRDTSLESVIEETNRIARNNSKGTVQEYPWHEGYDCSSAEERDPNCIYPGENIYLGESSADISTIGGRKETYFNSILGLSLLAIGALGATTYYKSKHERETRRELEKLVELKNENEHDSLDSLVKETGADRHQQAEHLEQSYDAYLRLYRQGKVEKKFERYDHQIAPDEMKEEMAEMYIYSDKNLEQVSEYLAEKYGMEVSSSTVSRRSREYLNVQSREEARNFSKPLAA